VGRERNGAEQRENEGFKGEKLTSVFQTPSCSRGCREGMGRDHAGSGVVQHPSAGLKCAKNHGVETLGPCFTSI